MKRANVVVLAGGFGGARMAHGFELLGESVALSVVVNTADDVEMHGLHVSPDLDTVMYTLAGLANNETGWGVRDDTWNASAMLERFGAPTWFRLGDRDLGTNVGRTARLRVGRLADQGDGAAVATARRARHAAADERRPRQDAGADGRWLAGLPGLLRAPPSCRCRARAALRRHRHRAHDR